MIGVGGFLGMGTKDVALPFKDVQWKTEPAFRSEPGAAVEQRLDQLGYGHRPDCGDRRLEACSRRPSIRPPWKPTKGIRIRP